MPSFAASEFIALPTVTRNGYLRLSSVAPTIFFSPANTESARQIAASATALKSAKHPTLTHDVFRQYDKQFDIQLGPRDARKYRWFLPPRGCRLPHRHAALQWFERNKIKRDHATQNHFSQYKNRISHIIQHKYVSHCGSSAISASEAQPSSTDARASGRMTMASWPLANSRYCQPFWRLTHSWVGTKAS
jgi:hypothetical protein